MDTRKMTDSKDKTILICAIFSMLLLGIGDVLLSLFPEGGEEFLGGFASTTWTEISNLPFMTSFVFGLIAAIFFAPSTYITIRFVKNISEDRCKGAVKMLTIGMVMMAVTLFAAHSVCCLVVMVIKAELDAGLMPTEITERLGSCLLTIFGLTNIWITISELLVSVAAIILILKKVLPVKKWMIIMNPICSYVIFKLMGAVVSAISGSSMAGKLLSGGASWGYGLLFVVILISILSN